MNKYVENHEQNYKEISIRFGLDVFVGRQHSTMKMIFMRGKKIHKNNITPVENHFSYPPSDFCKVLGRANYPNYPVFYAGESGSVICDEVEIIEDELFHLGIFRTKESVSLNCVLFLHDELNDMNGWKNVLTESKKYVRDQVSSEKFGSVWSKIQEASNIFRLDRSKYDLTATIAYEWIYNKGMDAIIYPSVRNDNFCNFALNPKFVDDNLELYKVLLCKRKNDDNLAFLKKGMYIDNEMVWSVFDEDDYNEYISLYKHLLL